VQARLSSSNGDVLADAAARGLGITLQPDFIVAPYLADGRLQPVLTEFAPPGLGIYALLPAGRHVTYRVRVLIEFLAERLKAASPGLEPRRAPVSGA
jgi:DNA-binding transcriptional LysR family regulator